jgi:hypothetical protein
MLRPLCLTALVACASAPPPKIETPEDYQRGVADLVAQVIDMFKTDGTNCDMLSHDLHALKAGVKFKTVHDWGTSHPDGPKLAKAKIDERNKDFSDAAAPAARACGGLSDVLMELTK